MESERTTLTARNKSLDGPGGPAGSDREEVEALAEHSTAGKGRSACGTAQEALAETPGETEVTQLVDDGARQWPRIQPVSQGLPWVRKTDQMGVAGVT